MRGVVVCVALAGCTSSAPSGKLITDLYVAGDLHAQAGVLTFETTTKHVVRMPADDPSQATILGDWGVPGLRVDDTTFYYYGPLHDDGTADLLAGSPPVTLAANLMPGVFDVGTTSVVASNGSQIVTIPLAGGAPVAVGPPVDPTLGILGVAIDGTNVYDVTHIKYEQLYGSCEQRPLDGSPSASNECPANLDLAVIAGTFYLTESCIQDTACGYLYTFTSIGQVKKLIAQSDSDYLYGLHVHGDHLYWITHNGIVQANLDGTDQTVIAQSKDAIRDYAVDDTDVYYATDIGLYRVPL